MLSSNFNGYRVSLVESVEELGYIRSLFRPKICVGVDTETTGLDYIKHHVVGVCLSAGPSYRPGEYEGFYLPIRHQVGNNLPVPVVMDFVQEILDRWVTMFWNRNFDASMLEKDGVQIPKISTIHQSGLMNDAQVMAHLIYNDKYPSLKAFARNLLNWEMIDFSDNGAKDNNFGFTDPRKSYIYAAGDPLATALLGVKIWADYPHIRPVYRLDNMMGETIRQMGKCEMYMDYEFLDQELEECQLKLRAISQQIYDYVGFSFNIKSNNDLADVLSGYVTLTEKTDKNKWKLDDEALSHLNHPLARMVQDFRGVHVHISTFVKKMSEWRGLPIRANYSAINVASGRLSSGGAKKNSFYREYNFQNCPKEEVKMHMHPHPVIGFYLNHDPQGSLGLVKTKEGLHRAFKAPDDWVWVTADYCLHPDSMVETDLGFYTLRELYGTDFRVRTPFGFRRAYNLRFTGDQEQIEITLNSGEVLVCSPHHGLWVERDGVEQWVTAGDLRDSDYVFTQADGVPHMESFSEQVRGLTAHYFCDSDIASLYEAYMLHGVVGVALWFRASPEWDFSYLIRSFGWDEGQVAEDRAAYHVLHQVPANPLDHLSGLSSSDREYALQLRDAPMGLLNLANFLHVSYPQLRRRYGPVLSTLGPPVQVANIFTSDSYLKYYLFGVVLGVGCLSQSPYGGLRLRISSSDWDHLQALAPYFPLFSITPAYKRNKMLSCSDKGVCDALVGMGIVPAKSDTGLRLPAIPSEFVHSFLLGLLDSDGWVTTRWYNKCVIGWCGHISYMRDEYVLLSGLFSHVGWFERSPTFAIIRVTRSSEVLDFMHRCYSVALPVLQRKLLKFKRVWDASQI